RLKYSGFEALKAFLHSTSPRGCFRNRRKTANGGIFLIANIVNAFQPLVGARVCPRIPAPPRKSSSLGNRPASSRSPAFVGREKECRHPWPDQPSTTTS